MDYSRGSRVVFRLASSITVNMDLLDTSNLREVYIACKPVSAQWRDLGIRLGLTENTLATIQADNPHSTMNCLSAMIIVWLRRPERNMSDNVLPSWRNLCLALSHIDKPLAERILEEHGCNYINPIASEINSKSGVPPAFLSQCCGCGRCTVKGWMTKKECQNMHFDRRPKLLVVNPGNPEVRELIKLERDDNRQIRLAQETSHLSEQFRVVNFETWNCLQQCFQEGKYQIADVAFKVATWLNKPLPNVMISQLHELQNWFHSLCVSWFNFRALQFVADTFLSKYPDLMATWSNYRSSFKKYCLSRSLKSFVNVFFQVEDQNVFLLEVDEEYHNFTLSDIEALRDSLSLALGVPSVCLHLVTIGKGCLIIYFHYCYSDYLMIFKSLTIQRLKSISEIEDYKILSLTDLHNQFTYDNIQKYNSNDGSAGSATASEKGSASLTDTSVTFSTGSPHNPIALPDTTVADTILAAERLKSVFESLCFLAMMISNCTTINLALLKLKIRLRLQYTPRDNTPAPAEVQEYLTNLEQYPNAESIMMFLINNNFLGYLNFDLLEAFKQVLSSDKFNEKLEEYQLAHTQFIQSNNLQNITQAFIQKPHLRPAAIVGLPWITMMMRRSWESSSLYDWKLLVDNIIVADWRPRPYIMITRIEFADCFSISFQLLPFIVSRVEKELTDETVARQFTAIKVSS